MDPRAQVVDDLLALIRKFAAPGVLAEIADGDSQALPDAAPKHLAALEELRDGYDWRLNRQRNNTWHPLEPIELISYAVDHHSRPAQVFCNALLMVAELEGADRDYMHFRWFQSPGEAWFRELPEEPWGAVLLAGFAVLHAEAPEMEREFWTGPDAKGAWITPQGER